MSSPCQTTRPRDDLRVAHNGEEERRLADTVPAEHREAGAFGKRQRYAVEHHGGAVAGAHIVEREQRLGHDSCSRRRLVERFAEIDRAHPRIGGDLLRAAFDQNPPADHDDDPRGKAKHQLHVMLDEQHGDFARQTGNGGKQFLAFLARHAGCRLVEQQNLRARRKRERDLKQALLAVSEFARHAVADRIEIERRKNAVGFVNFVAVGGKLTPPGARGAAFARIPQASPTRARSDAETAS